MVATPIKSGINAFSSAPVELTDAQADFAVIIRAAYRQVMGNAHVMDSERLIGAESQLINGDLSVRGFVRALAQSAQYQERFFNTSSPYRFVELNFKHLLGRAPQDQAEISEHVRRYNEQGYAADIDSYINSEEYATAFGENTVPFYRATKSLVGQKQVGFNRMFALLGGSAETDTPAGDAKLYAVASNSANAIVSTSVGNGAAVDAPGKRFKIVVTGQKAGGRRRSATTTYTVAGDNISPTIQRIHRTGGRVASIEEI